MKLYDVKELSELLKIQERAVTRLIRKGQIPAQKIGQKWYTTEQALQQYIEGNNSDIEKAAEEQLKNTVIAAETYYKKLSKEEKAAFRRTRRSLQALEQKVNALLAEKKQ